MKQKTTVVLIILGLLILASLCFCENHSTEGLNIMKRNTHVLHRGEYMDNVGYLKSEDGSYLLTLRNGTLTCKAKDNGRWKPHWDMNANGYNLLLLDDYGTLQFKSSKNAEYTPVTKTDNAKSLILTAYGTLELKGETDGDGETLWTYPVTEGLENDDITDLFDDMSDNRLVLENQALDDANTYLTSNATVGGVNKILGGDDSAATVGGWKTFYENSKHKTVSSSLKLGNIEKLPPSSSGLHSDLMNKNREMVRLRNTLDNKVKVLNAVGDSHVTEQQMHLDSTLYISLAWTAVASTLVYYTFTH
jgi:hypothetical protein